MIEEIAVVAKVENHQVWVESKPASGCGGCKQNGSCSTSVLSKMIRKRSVEVDSDIDLRAGDEVVIGIQESVLIRASMLLYLTPLVVMVLVGMSVQELLPPEYDKADLTVAGMSLLSLGLTLWVINKMQASFFFPYFSRPVVLKKV
ncbi:SoxR reducing system RseC family protein [Methylicorpusculum oleiharenae]|uniref:SoxR reducing system RseC family protein n=1 Tax=Methylicorpusculum oleiharenae TaxID=1338687 RepID=UPI0013570FF3|nr:SoxR reducing system RseC family protein [Methylicorpusculum oleiharenae]MCD2449256.1 SoxR reducing system RseC family protein [Methylicorpusculum oleiharenae]